MAATLPMTSTDREVLEIINRRRPAGMEILFERYGELAYSLAVHILKDESGAEEVVSEAFLSVWHRAAHYDSNRGTVRDWLCELVHRQAIARLRNRAPAPVPQMNQPADPWRVCPTDLVQGRSRAALAALPVDQREVLELAYFAGCSPVETSDRLRMPLDTVRSLMQMALRTLRAVVNTATPDADHLRRPAGG